MDKTPNWSAWIADLREFYTHPDSPGAQLDAKFALEKAEQFLAGQEGSEEEIVEYRASVRRVVKTEFDFDTRDIGDGDTPEEAAAEIAADLPQYEWDDVDEEVEVYIR